MGEQKGGDQHTQEGALARLWGTNKGQVTTSTGKIQEVWLLRLLLRVIEQTDRSAKAAKGGLL